MGTVIGVVGPSQILRDGAGWALPNILKENNKNEYCAQISLSDRQSDAQLVSRGGVQPLMRMIDGNGFYRCAIRGGTSRLCNGVVKSYLIGG